ncbi:ImmA/IrrE family metallo-endopeptidase [uncultured Amnibacterium sp.]|uniref:ImmA/IrrE family metallo-endopeptidase n=1 Tax=uncultured Amnibacterium sp. TaxID=1631851 RepID=UPI0035C98FE1
MTLRRGFKTEAEKRAASVRAELGLAANDRLDPRDLALARGVAVVDADTLVPREQLEELEALQAYAFSAATFHIRDRTVIVVNNLHDIGRQNSDISHELSHVLLDHDLSEVRELNGMPFRTCRPEQEEEATTLGATLLLPRELLLSALRHRLTVAQIAVQYEVTPVMAKYRVNTTGVARQLGLTGR